MFRIIKRQFFKELRICYNLKYNRRRKCKAIFWFVVSSVKAIFWGLVGMTKEQLGSRIWYDGQPGLISNWSGSSCPSVKLDNGSYIKNADRRLIKKARNLREFYHRFIFIFGWWMGSHQSTYIDRKVGK